MNRIKGRVILFNRLLIYLSLSLLSFSGSGQELTVYYNGKIFTSDPKQLYAEALAVEKGVIVGVGQYDKIKKQFGGKGRLIDLKGRFLMPGLIDSHNHAISGGRSLTRANVFEELLGVGQLARFVEDAVNEKKGFTGDVLVVYGVNIATWSSVDSLKLIFNSVPLSETPVILRGSDGHTLWANRKMLEKAGIDSSYLKKIPSSLRSYFGMDADGSPNGFIADSGMNRIMAAVPKIRDEKVAAEKMIAHLNSLGITAWLDPSVTEILDEEHPVPDAYLYLADQKRLTAHVKATVVADADGNPGNQIAKLLALQKKYHYSHLFSIIGFKIFSDGVIEHPTHTAALSEKYTHLDSKGPLLFRPENFARFATLADKNKLLVHVHAIGDLAVTETLNGFEKVRKANPGSSIPHTITHMQIVQPGDFSRFGELNIIASLQLLWAFHDVTTIDIVQPCISPQLFRWQYPARSLLQAGTIIAGASDWPVSSANPFEAIARAETRKGDKGILDAAQCMPRLEMIYAYTRNAAAALMMENSIGSLESGKSADFIITDRDVLTVNPDELSETKVLLTVFQGKPVFKSPEY